MTQSGEAPGDLELLRSFVNTREVDEDQDFLADSATAAGWLEEWGWPKDTVLGQPDREVLCRLREAFRSQLLEHAGHDRNPSAAEVLSDIAGKAPLVVYVLSSQPTLLPAGDGVSSVIGRLMAAYYAATVDGQWQRLKACQKDTCQWAYYDQSKNGSRKWCTSTGCGNVMAARAYRSRQRQGAASSPPTT